MRKQRQQQPRRRRRGLLFSAILLVLATSFPRSVRGAAPRPGRPRVLDFETDCGAVPFDDSFDVCAHNAEALRRALQYDVSGGGTLHVRRDTTFYLHHGVSVSRVHDARIVVDGTIRFQRADLPINARHPFPACLTFTHARNVTVTSGGGGGDDPDERGVIDGQGWQWWGYPLIGYLRTEENRPRLLRFNVSADLLLERVILQDSPYHTLYLDAVHDVTIRHLSVVARRTVRDGHSWVDLTAFNTDGIDVSGSRVHVHDVDIWVQDDCIAVKDVYNHTNRTTGINDEPYESAHMVFERINATGLGFVVGSLQGSHVHNITFRDSYLHKPVKGIYLKFAHRSRRVRNANLSALIEDVLYENITVVAPQQWPIWMGPAQQADNRNPCHANPCSLCWPMTPGTSCHTVPRQRLRNVTLRNVRIHDPVFGAGVLLGDAAYPLRDVVFEDVRVTRGLLPPPMARRPLRETFPGTRRPVRDPYAPPAYAHDLSRRVEGVCGWIVRVVRVVGHAVQTVVERLHVAVALRLLSGTTQDGSQTWYLSYLARTLLGTVWIWIVCAVGFAVAGVFSFRGWMRYRRRRRDATTMDVVVGEDDQDDAEEALLLRRARVETRWPPLLCHVGFIALLCVCWGGALYTGTFPFLKPKWERTYRYYACEHVVNGIARGHTWPVPYCFRREERTNPWWPDDEPHHHGRGHGSGRWLPRKVEIDAVRIVLTRTLAVVAAAVLLIWRRRRQPQWRIPPASQHQQQQPTEESPPPEGRSEQSTSPIPSFVTVQTNPDDDDDDDDVEDDVNRPLLSGDNNNTPLAARRSGSVDFADPLKDPAFD